MCAVRDLGAEDARFVSNEVFYLSGQMRILKEIRAGECFEIIKDKNDFGRPLADFVDCSAGLKTCAMAIALIERDCGCDFSRLGSPEALKFHLRICRKVYEYLITPSSTLP